MVPVDCSISIVDALGIPQSGPKPSDKQSGALTGELWGVSFQDFEEYWPCFSSTRNVFFFYFQPALSPPLSPSCKTWITSSNKTGLQTWSMPSPRSTKQSPRWQMVAVGGKGTYCKTASMMNHSPSRCLCHTWLVGDLWPEPNHPSFLCWTYCVLVLWNIIRKFSNGKCQFLSHVSQKSTIYIC